MGRGKIFFKKNGPESMARETALGMALGAASHHSGYPVIFLIFLYNGLSDLYIFL